MTGSVEDLRPVYAGADVVVVPLATGAGTRIKLLEAFAYGVPVVASSVAAAGLEVRDRVHLLLADDPDGMAAAVAAISKDSALAGRLTEAAGCLVRERYSTSSVIPLIDDFLARARVRAESSLQDAGSL